MRFLIRTLVVVVLLAVVGFVGVLMVGSGMEPEKQRIEKIIPNAP
ncbi:hypothetical protein [Phaeovibrio sulfidiphilus]|nr:hypothetical protein [Phaeovibrio sulfidiphilus]